MSNTIRNIQHILLSLQSLTDLVAVGGCVRDLVMYNKSYGDVDLATSDDKETIIRKLKEINYPVYVINDKYSTVGTIHNNQYIEITPFRKDTACDGRHTETEVGTLLEDMARRDFTINALYMGKDMAIHDPLNGLEDIKNKVIRTCEDARTRFDEDQLRIFRAMRFAATLNFTLDDDLLDAISATPIDKVSIERIVKEIDKCFTCNADTNRPSTMFKYMLYTGKLQEFLPEISFMTTLGQSPVHHPEGSVFVHTMKLLDMCYKYNRWEALFHDIGKIDTFELYKDTNYYCYRGHEEKTHRIDEIAARLKLSNEVKQSCINIARYHMYPYQLTNYGNSRASISQIRKFRNKTNGFSDKLYDICLTEFKLKPVTDTQLANFTDLFFRKIEEECVLKPILTGKFLISKGYKPGKIFGEIIQKGLEYQLETGCLDPEEIYDKITKDSNE